MLSCNDVAQYFLSLQDEEAGETISNLKLQKLMYYAQGVHLALYNAPLFEEPIEAWTHGPVVPTLYHSYKQCGNQALPKPVRLTLSKYDRRTKEVLDDVWTVFGQYSAWKLRNMTHSEAPWVEAKKPGRISHVSMKKHFKTLLK